MPEFITLYWSYAVAMITAVLFVSTKGRKFASVVCSICRKIMRSVLYPFRVPRILDSMDTSIKSIKKELTYNGGNSLKDVVAKTLKLATLLELRHKYELNISEKPMYECEASGGRCTWVNDSLCELFGMSHEEMLGLGWLRAIKEEERQEVYEHWMHAIQTNIPYSWSYTIVNQKTGDEIEVKSTANAVSLSNGTILQYHGTVSPIKKKI